MKINVIFYTLINCTLCRHNLALQSGKTTLINQQRRCSFIFLPMKVSISPWHKFIRTNVHHRLCTLLFPSCVFVLYAESYKSLIIATKMYEAVWFDVPHKPIRSLCMLPNLSGSILLRGLWLSKFTMRSSLF